MIEDVWKKTSADILSTGYRFQKIGVPSPTDNTISKCRDLCAQNLCGAYGRTWGCPPGVGNEKECLDTVRKYSHAAVITKKYADVDFKDAEHLHELQKEHQDVCRKFSNALRKEGYDAMVLADGSCEYCGVCSYPEPCKFPDQIIASVSSYGILMDEYMTSEGIEFAFDGKGMTLYGVVLYNQKTEKI